MFNASRVIGPAVAGLLIGAFSISIAFLLNGISFIAVIVAYLMMRTDELRPAPVIVRPTTVRGVFASLAEGGRFVRQTPLVLLSVTVVGLVATFGMNFQVLMPPYADNVLNVGAAGYGFLMAASGLGSTVAALWIAFSRKVSPLPIILGAIALGLGTIVVAFTTSFGVALLAMVVVGAGGIGMAVTANTTIQLSVPDHLRGRVMSLYTTVFAGSVPAGGLLMGWIASAWGVPAALLVGAILSLVVGVACWPWLARIRRDQREARANRPEVAAIATGGSAADPRLTIARRR
jgi:MFS family permease